VEYYRNAGFKVALDDLGSGYGSLKLLSRLKPDFVKLDIDLIRGVDHDAYKAAIAGTIFELARKLGVATVAEGIETEAEWAWVRDHGADYAQGFFIARPGSPPPRPRGCAASHGQAIAADCGSRAPLAANAERAVG
jgi:EAL domain-containing protein (putative c-di-GMP-specific phosphodiesterase class I)